MWIRQKSPVLTRRCVENARIFENFHLRLEKQKKNETKNLLLPRLLSVSTSLTFLVMAYVSSSGDMATISWMLRPEWPGTGSGAASWDSPPEGSSDSDFMAEDDWEASGSPASPLTDSSAELRGDSGAGLQLADVFGVPSA